MWIYDTRMQQLLVVWSGDEMRKTVMRQEYLIVFLRESQNLILHNKYLQKCLFSFGLRKSDRVIKTSEPKSHFYFLTDCSIGWNYCQNKEDSYVGR